MMRSLLLIAVLALGGVIGYGINAARADDPLAAYCQVVPNAPTGPEGLLRDAHDLLYDVQPGTHLSYLSASWEAHILACLLKSEEGARR